MSFALSQPQLNISESNDFFPVGRIHCVGRNYPSHAQEMGSSGREPPFFFAKFADALVSIPSGHCARIAYPPRTSDFHHEVELVVAIGEMGCNISQERALRHVYGYAVGVDLTRRSLQSELKKRGQPWEMAKSFDQSAPVGPIHRIETVEEIGDSAIWLRVNGEMRQSGRISEMIWTVPEIIAELSTYLLLRPGDLIFTGTPSGVGSLLSGDNVAAGIDRLGEIMFEVA